MSAEAIGGLRVVVADGSACVRQSLRSELAHEPGVVVVAVSGDPRTLAARLPALRPDVLVLDDRFLAEDAAGVRAALESTRGAAVLLLVSESGDPIGPTGPVRARVPRPTEDLVERTSPFVDAIVRELRALAERPKARPSRADSGRASGSPAAARPPRVIAIGASTGGTVALRHILDRLPSETPGIVIVQHMPERFTGSFAENLDRTAAMEVRLAADGDAIRAGLTLVAPGNRHLEVVADGRGHLVRISDAPPVNRHRPSVDVLFRSVACHVGPQALGVLLTGMGADGAQGLLEMRRSGAHTLAQDEATSVVFGMPREAIELGAADQVLALDVMATEIARRSGLAPSRPGTDTRARLPEPEGGMERWRRS